MSNELVLVWRLYWPFVGAAVAVMAAVLIHRRLANSEDLEGEIPTIDVSLVFISLPVRIRRIWFVYGFCSCAALWSLSVAFTRDYSSFFPTRLHLEVFYDRAGIEATLSEIVKASGGDSIQVAKNWWSERAQYYAIIDGEAAPSLGQVVQFFAKSEAAVHSVGETSFVTKKISGWQNYHIEESTGEVLHTLEAPNEPSCTLLTSFRKLDTSNDYLRPTFRDLVFHRAIVMKPRFKQYLSARRTSESVPFKISVIGMTVIRLFPLPEFSNTLYLADVPEVGLVPIAYAVYVPDGDAGGSPE